MSGGIGLVRRDSDAEYARFRKEVFKIEMAPLPKSLALSQNDSKENDSKQNDPAKLVAR
jgi:hypothetical protein